MPRSPRSGAVSTADPQGLPGLSPEISTSFESRLRGGERSYSFVMLNLFQHPWPDLQSRAAPKETAGPWTLKQVQGDEIRNVVFRPLAVIPRKEKARAEARASPPWQAGRSSEGQPILFLRSEEHTSELQSLMRISSVVFCLQQKP